jgi:hypothetical protein
MKISGDAHFNKLTVPYSMLEHAVRYGSFNELQVLLCSKALFGNGFREVEMKHIAHTCRLHVKTVKKHISKLKSKNWLGYDPASARYINRGWIFLRTSVGDNTNVGYSIPTNLLFQFKAFAIAATYDQLIATQQYQFWLQNRERNKKGTSQQTGMKSKGFYPIANLAYGKIHGLSKATASRYRQKAVNAGFIEVEEQLTPLLVPDGVKLYHERLSETTGEALVFRNQQYYLQGITHVRSKMIRKRICSIPGKN